jgi:hypothetical protein
VHNTAEGTSIHEGWEKYAEGECHPPADVETSWPLGSFDVEPEDPYQSLLEWRVGESDLEVDLVLQRHVEVVPAAAAAEDLAYIAHTFEHE